MELGFEFRVEVLVAQLCPTVCNLMDRSPPGSSVHGILQARILEWVAIPFSRGSSCLKDRTQVFCVSCIAGEFFTAEPPGKPPSSPYQLSVATHANCQRSSNSLSLSIHIFVPLAFSRHPIRARRHSVLISLTETGCHWWSVLHELLAHGTPQPC